MDGSCDELGDRRDPVELGNSVGSNADAALMFKAMHGRVVMSHSTARLGNGSSMPAPNSSACTSRQKTRFEASPLRGNSEFDRVACYKSKVWADMAPELEKYQKNLRRCALNVEK
jgi:hypothetical protein